MKKTILIIDDEEIIRSLLKTYLELLNYNIITASDGFEGIDIYKCGKPKIDLVLLDYRMPGLTGDEVYGRLKDLDGNLKTIIVSGSIDDQLKKVFLMEGIDDCIHKPVDLSELSLKIKTVLQN